jgi:hypothetical protein
VSNDIIPLLETLRAEGLAFIETEAGQRSEQALYSVVESNAGTALTKSQDLVKLIRHDARFSTVEQKRYIRLPDTTDAHRKISPLVYLDGDFSRPHPHLSVQLVVVAHSNLANEQSQCLVLRFETPAGLDPAGTGDHDYYHSQLCVDVRVTGPGNTMSFPGSIAWRPLSCPTWPLDAKTPAHLMACIIFSLYGKGEGARMLRQAYGGAFAQRLEGMHFAFAEDEAAKKKRARRVRRKKRR